MSNEQNGIPEAGKTSRERAGFAFGNFCYKLLTISVFFSVGCGLLFARPSEPAMRGDKTEKTQKYEKVISRIGYFYKEDAPRSREVSPGNIFVETPVLKTQEEARERFEKNKETYNDLLGWRMPFDDFCKSGNRWLESIALVDIQAKARFLEELLSPRMKDLAPDLAREQFEMSLKLVADIFSEAENDSPEELYKPILELPKTTKIRDGNLALEMAKFMYIRQNYLIKNRECILARERDALLVWAENKPQKIYEYFLPLRSVSRRCSREAEILEVPSELQGDRDFHALLYFLATPPISAKLQKQLPELQKTLIAYRLTAKKSKPRSRGGCGGGC